MGEQFVPSMPAGADWDRDQWVAYADRLLAAARPFASAGNARITFPGAEGGYGRAVDGLEGFARTFLLAGFRIAGARGEGVDDLIDFYARGIAAGVDPDAEDRWVRLDEHGQAKVEAASLAVVLDMTRPWIWERLDATTRERVIAYLAPAVGDDTYPKTNWLWFRLVVETFLRSVGGPWSPEDVAADLALHDSLVREDGWISDGFERAYDHYVGWALHVYPVLWSRMQGADELAGDRTAGDVALLDRYLQDAVALVGGDGSPLVQGRSLIYRYAAAAPFWVGAIAGVPSVPLGQLRRAAGAMVGHFAERGAPDADGILSLGWHDEWRMLAQSYSGTGSPYWAVKGLLGIALPADHPVWTAEPIALPIETGDDLRSVRAAGWIVSATAADGIVRVINHGTDKALAGGLVGDSPLYARIGYSTATAPLLDADAWLAPLEQSAVLVSGDGRVTHRSAMELLDVRVQDDTDGRVGIATSRSRAHWITPRPAENRHGAGVAGDVEIAGTVEIHSLVRGPWEVRLVRVTDLTAAGVEAVALRIGGWAVAADADAGITRVVAEDGALAAAGALRSSIRSLGVDVAASVVVRADAGPLGAYSAVPVVETAVAPGEWTAVIVELSATDAAPQSPAGVVIDADGTISVTWPDARATTSRLIDSGRA
ncbi:hypothetical protein JOD63_003049 [Microbacterium terrae]|uniref:DUF2264 domain-containing protein n=1 Tax=Microbacterium terrae TaxID=69369 RepID=A0A0M2H8C1_9MICO|nr:DUF2264 domain-containing protein [Microbacterium terrae]KJL42651.1 hypothetical protein RS81_01153 [Microbacterium terrae]MBP1079081.1 hypothetical protein [Microbacterium terrae]GLJ98481.1 hypothetical protein GCM10017594_16780 [Microbacterium terrae]